MIRTAASAAPAAPAPASAVPADEPGMPRGTGWDGMLGWSEVGPVDGSGGACRSSLVSVSPWGVGDWSSGLWSSLLGLRWPLVKSGWYVLCPTPIWLVTSVPTAAAVAPTDATVLNPEPSACPRGPIRSASPAWADMAR